MGRQTKKALNFDFYTNTITNNMSEQNISGTYRKAYYDIKSYLLNNGFLHEQESSYTSNESMSNKEVYKIVENITTKIPYLKNAIKSLQITDVERTYEISELLHNEHNLEVLKPSNLFILQTTYGVKIDDNVKNQKSIRFDLDGEILSNKFKEENIDYDINIAYNWIKNYFEDLGYTHQQGSVYKTPKSRTDSEVIKDLLQFSKELPYVAEAFNSVQITNVGRVFDVTEAANGLTKKDTIKSQDKVENSKLNEKKISNTKDLGL